MADCLSEFILLFACSQNRRPQDRNCMYRAQEISLLSVIIVVGWTVTLVVIVVEAKVGVMTVAV